MQNNLFTFSMTKYTYAGQTDGLNIVAMLTRNFALTGAPSSVNELFFFFTFKRN